MSYDSPISVNPLAASSPASTQNTQKPVDEELLKACKEFESLFVSYLLQTMRKTSQMGGELFGNGLGSDIYSGMFDTEVAQKMSEGKGLGLAPLLYKHLYTEGNTEDIVPLSLAASQPHWGIIRSSVQSAAAQAGLDQKAKSTTVNHTARESANPFSVRIPSQVSRWSGTMFQRIQPYHQDIMQASGKYQMDPALVYAVISQESAGNPTVVSKSGAKGLMQLMDGTASELGVQNSFDPKQNIEGGTKYLRQQIDRFGGDLKLALAAYNAGPGAVSRYGGIPPYKETTEYVDKVMAYYQEYKPLLT